MVAARPGRLAATVGAARATASGSATIWSAAARPSTSETLARARESVTRRHPRRGGSDYRRRRDSVVIESKSGDREWACVQRFTSSSRAAGCRRFRSRTPRRGRGRGRRAHGATRGLPRPAPPYVRPEQRRFRSLTARRPRPTASPWAEKLPLLDRQLKIQHQDQCVRCDADLGDSEVM